MTHRLSSNDSLSSTQTEVWCQTHTYIYIYLVPEEDVNRNDVTGYKTTTRLTPQGVYFYYFWCIFVYSFMSSVCLCCVLICIDGSSCVESRSNKESIDLFIYWYWGLVLHVAHCLNTILLSCFIWCTKLNNVVDIVWTWRIRLVLSFSYCQFIPLTWSFVSVSKAWYIAFLLRPLNVAVRDSEVQTQVGQSKSENEPLVPSNGGGRRQINRKYY